MANSQFYATNSLNRARLRRQLRIATQFPAEVAEDSIRIIGEDLVKEVKESLSGPGTGRTYVKSNPHRIHIASAPFEPPASDLGRLWGSYKILRLRKGGDRGSYVEVGSHVDYSLYLEYGTRNMRPRPHLRPAAARTASHIPGIIQAVARAKGVRLRSGT